jgi:hypothetical protein
LIFCLWWGLDLTATYGLSPGDGSVLAPLPQRLAFGSAIALFGVACAAGMGLYGRLYAARIGFNPDRRQVYLEGVGLLGNIRHVIDRADLGGVRFHRDVCRGRVGAVVGHPVPTVDVPWMSVQIAGRRLPLIVDRRGEVLDPELMRVLFGGPANG